MVKQAKTQKKNPPAGSRVKRSTAVALSIFILLSSIAYLLDANLRDRRFNYEASGGHMDLTEVDLAREKWVNLNGEWQFYEGQLIVPPQGGDFSQTLAVGEGEVRTVRVPGPWHLSDESESPSHGFGTYRLVVDLPQEGIYGIRTKTVRSASRVFMNGQEVISLGEVAETADTYVPGSRYEVGFMRPRDGKIEIIMQVSNYYYTKGGIITSIEFGASDDLIRKVNRETTFEIVLSFSFISTGILAFIIYVLTRRQRYLLHFSLGCLFMALYLTVMNNQVLNYLVELDIAGRTRVQLIGIGGVIFFFTSFVGHFFRSIVNRKINLVVRSLILISLVAVILDPYWMMASAMRFLQLYMGAVMLLSFGYMAWVTTKAMVRRVIAVEYVLVVVVSLSSYWLSLLVKALFDWKMTHYPEWMLLFVLLSMVYMIGERLYQGNREMIELTDKRLERELDYYFSQISPHFVYNTINTIIAMSYEDDHETRVALNHLATYFRGKLDFHKRKGLVPLDTELEMVTAYLEIEKMRYRDRLTVEYDLTEGLDCMIPPLSIQPLVENAVKHGVIGSGGSGTVTISTRRLKDNRIRIAIKDDGVGMTRERLEAISRGDTGRMGHQNVKKRIELTPGASCRITSEVGKGTTVELLIPEGGNHANHSGHSD